MAVKTVFSEEELTQLFSNYDLGDYINSTPFTEGTVQTNMAVRTTKGRFVFRYYENRSKGSVLFETDLLNYLKHNKYPCPGPYLNKQASFVGMYNSKPYVVFEYMDGHHEKAPTERQKRQLIQKAAELHRLTQNYVPVHNENRWNYSVEFCQGQARQASERINTFNSKAKFIWLEKELLNLHLPDSLPMGVCHSDFHFSNLLFKNDEVVALLDFDDANYTYLLFDLVGLIESWAWRHDTDKTLNFTEAKKVTAEYMKHRPLTPVEKRHLFDVYKLSIFIDCIWFFERGEVDDFYEKRKIDYLDSLGREPFNQKLFE